MPRAELRLFLAAVAALALPGCCRNAPPPAAPAATAPAEPVAEQPAEPLAEPTAKPGSMEFPDEPFRHQRPTPTAPRPFRIPSLQQFSIAPDIQVYLVERHSLPTISLELEVGGGDINDPPGKEGLASVCMSLLTRGTAKYDQLALAEVLANMGSGLNSGAGSETQSVSMTTLSRFFDETLDLWADSLLAPAYRKEDFDREVALRIDGLAQQRATPNAVESRVSPTVVHGATHPYARITTEKSLARLRVTDCSRYHRRYLRPSGSRLFVVGDVTEQQLRDSLGARLKGWRGRPAASQRVGPARPPAGRIFFVDVPNAAQSAVSLRHRGPKRTAPDYFATRMMARILGGGFSSRVNMNLREDKGYAYGARGGFSYDLMGSSFYLNASVQTDKTKESVEQLFAEFEDLLLDRRPVTEVELSREKNGEILSMPATFATSRQVLASYQSLIYYGVGLDFFAGFVDNIQAVTAEQISAAAHAHLLPEQVRALVVGDRATVLPGLYALTAAQALGDGALVILDADGKTLETVTAAEAAKRLAAH